MISSYPPPGPYIGDPALTAWLLDAFSESRPMYQHSHDLPDEFFTGLVEMCKRLECAPIDMAGCWMSESQVSPRAHNAGGNASGVFQAMPQTLAGLGFPGRWNDFLALSAVEQLVWAEKFYGPHKGHLGSAAACYLVTFMPILAAHANEPPFVICARNGPFAYAYKGNYGAFDPTGKGYIMVSDLTDRIERVTTGPRWQEIADRIRLAQKDAPTDPALVAGGIADEMEDDPPVFVVPSPPDEAA